MIFFDPSSFASRLKRKAANPGISRQKNFVTPAHGSQSVASTNGGRPLLLLQGAARFIRPRAQASADNHPPKYAQWPGRSSGAFGFSGCRGLKYRLKGVGCIIRQHDPARNKRPGQKVGADKRLDETVLARRQISWQINPAGNVRANAIELAAQLRIAGACHSRSQEREPFGNGFIVFERMLFKGISVATLPRNSLREWRPCSEAFPVLESKYQRPSGTRTRPPALKTREQIDSTH